MQLIICQNLRMHYNPQVCTPFHNEPNISHFSPFFDAHMQAHLAVNLD